MVRNEGAKWLHKNGVGNDRYALQLSSLLKVVVLQDICLRYPAWFEAHEAGLDPAEMERFRKQYEYMQQIIELYERDPDNTIELMSLMQQVQQYGQPPQEIVDQVAPSEDLTGMFQGCAPGFVPPADLPEMPEDCKMQ
eukprot:evm.model.scf_1759.6 EVM.evm.TU.scf_1759.6   scf_1759:33520-34427(-)